MKTSAILPPKFVFHTHYIRVTLGPMRNRALRIMTILAKYPLLSPYGHTIESVIACCCRVVPSRRTILWLLTAMTVGYPMQWLLLLLASTNLPQLLISVLLFSATQLITVHSICCNLRRSAIVRGRAGA